MDNLEKEIVETTDTQVENNTEDKNTEERPTENVVDATKQALEEEKEEVKTFTQEEVNEIIRKRLDREKNKAAEENQTVEDRVKGIELELETTKAKNYALTKGVQPENLDRLIKLAQIEQGETMNENLDKVLEDFQDVFIQTEVAKPHLTTGSAAKNKAVEEAKKREAAFRKRMNL